MRIPFQSPLDAEITADARMLYLQRKPLFPIAYGTMGTVMLGLSFYLGGRAEAVEHFLFVLAGLIFLILAFALPQLGWAWWWPRLVRDSGPTLSGEITPEGIRWGSEPELCPWSAFMAIKLNERAALLYATPAAAFPLHRSMFADDAEWQSVTALLAVYARR